MSTDPYTLDQDARVWCTVQLDGRPVVSPATRKRGALAVISEALARLADIRTPRSRILHHQPAEEPSASARACSGTCNPERPE